MYKKPRKTDVSNPCYSHESAAAAAAAAVTAAHVEAPAAT